MIGLDTNVVIRYLAQDDPVQSRAATRLIEDLTPDAPGFLSSVVLAEAVWVMQDVYDASRDDIAKFLESLLSTRSLNVQNAAATWSALHRFRVGNADFADYLIERTCAGHGCDATFTFDKRAGRERDCGMTILK